MELIAFTGLRGSGKTTTCQIIKDILHDIRSVYHISFADFLRDWVRNNFGEKITALSKTRILKDSSYDDIIPIITDGNSFDLYTNLSPRELLINAGTFLRKINEDIFCIALEHEIKNIYLENPDNPLILIDDLRFENERKWFKSIEYPTSLIMIDRIDYIPSLEDAEANDFIDYEYTDIIHTTYTYMDPLTSNECRNEVIGL